MKIVNIDFPDIEEGGLVFDEFDSENRWNPGFRVVLWNKSTGKVKMTNVRVADCCPDEYSGEEQRELLTAAFLLEEKRTRRLKEMPYKKEPGDNVSNVKNYLGKGWIVECVDDSQSGWLTLKRPEGPFQSGNLPVYLRPGECLIINKDEIGKLNFHDCWITDGTYDTNPCLKKGKLYRVQDTDGEGYFVTLKGVPGCWRTNRLKVFTSKLEDLKYEVPVKIKLPYASKLLGEDLYIAITKRKGGRQ